jgi:hypothetical protein
MAVAVLGLGAVMLASADAAGQHAPPGSDAAAQDTSKKAEGKKRHSEAKKSSKHETEDAKGEDGKKGSKRRRGCPSEMTLVEGRFCIDRWEAYTVEIGDDGQEHKHSPYEPVDGKTVRAKSAAGHVPQAYISRDEAEQACKHARKRLCTDDEWITACKGKKPTAFPYGDEWQPRRCNDQGF